MINFPLQNPYAAAVPVDVEAANAMLDAILEATGRNPKANGYSGPNANIEPHWDPVQCWAVISGRLLHSANQLLAESPIEFAAAYHALPADLDFPHPRDVDADEWLASHYVVRFWMAFWRARLPVQSLELANRIEAARLRYRASVGPPYGRDDRRPKLRAQYR